MIDRAWIASRIPHQGSMCLLDGVEHWDEQSIVCIADSHRRADNPLRADGRLGITAAIEYAAQAMAVHCALLIDAAAAPASGYLTSVRQVSWQRPYLDDVDDVLRIHARRLSGSELNVLYSFEVRAAAESWVSGRAGVVLNAAGLQTADRSGASMR